MTRKWHNRSIAVPGWAVVALVAGVASACLSARRPLTAQVQADASGTVRETVRDRPSAAPTQEPPFEGRARQLQAAALGELPGVFDEFRRLPDGEREEALEWLFARWVKLDAEDGWRFAQARLGVIDRSLFLTAWALIDAETAGSHATNDNCELSGIFRELRGRDARGAARFIAAIPERKVHWVSTGTAGDLAELFAVDPEATIRAAVKFDFSEWGTLVAPLAEHDVGAAWEMLRGIRLKAERLKAWDALMTTGKVDRQRLMELVEAEREIPAAQREEMLATLLHRRAEEVCGDDPVRQRDWLLGEFTRRGMRAQPSSWLSRRAAWRAIEDASPGGLAAVLADLKGREAADFEVFAHLNDAAIEAARRHDGSYKPDPFADEDEQHSIIALEMLAQQPAGRARDLALAMVLKNAPLDMMAEWRGRLDDPEARAELGAKMLEEGARADAVDAQVVSALGADFDETFAHWVRAEVKLVSEGRSSSWSGRRAEQLADVFVEQPGEAMDDGSVEAIVNGFARMEPDAGLRLVERLPASRQPAAAAGLMRQWATTDPTAASEWLVAQQGAVREAGAAALSSALADTEPDAAFAWGESLATLGMRADVLGEVVATWAARDAEGARQRIDASSLPPEEKEALHQRITPP